MVRVHSGLPYSRMPFLYILQSMTTQKFYIGSAVDVPSRLAEHERGQSPYTRNRGPWKAGVSEEYETLAEARRRERQLKSWKSHRSIGELINGKSRG